MIDIKQAVKSATEYLISLYDSVELNDLMLEEVELSEDDQYWLVTLGFTTRISVSVEPVLKIAGHKEAMRQFKVIKINTITGEPLSMKIREL